MLKLAQYVDSKMRAIAENRIGDNFSLAVLTAVKIAHEYHRLKTKLEGDERETSKPLTAEDRQRVRERRQRHHTRRWYETQLLAITNGELSPTREQHKALIALGRIRGWNRPAPGKIYA